MFGAVTYDMVVPPGDFVAWTLTPSSSIDASFGAWKEREEYEQPLEKQKRLLDNSDDVVVCIRREDSVTCSTRHGSFQINGIKPDEHAYLPITVSTRDTYIRPSFTIAQSGDFTAAARASVAREEKEKVTYYARAEKERRKYLARRIKEGLRFLASEGVDKKGITFSSELKYNPDVYDISTGTYRRPLNVVFAFPPCRKLTTWRVVCEYGTHIEWDDRSKWGGTIDFSRDGDRVTAHRIRQLTGRLEGVVLHDGEGNEGEELLIPLFIGGNSSMSPRKGCVIQ
ncbi:hypothetical protein KIPB_006714 [Kipferlia bialata]|uniref:Uncharacterized protein n=1 Tax=Kipferlia bialata TaxID=797122 RepID=A0A391NMJ8_9EUKA|nr:hypothetical protein KIPB_006714 [Kipferlia bialata]|eukprot:g6714.t1